MATNSNRETAAVPQAVEGGDLIAQTTTATGLGPAGYVASMAGAVIVFRSGGVRELLTPGDPVFPGDVLETPLSGGLSIVLTDGTVIALAADSRMMLDEAIYDATTGNGTVALEIIHGGLIVVGGRAGAADPNAVIVKSPMAEIAVGAAQVGVELTPGEPLRVIDMALSDGRTMAVTVRNGGGTARLDAAEEGTFVTDSAIAPADPVVFGADDVATAFSGPLGFLPEGGLANAYGFARPDTARTYDPTDTSPSEELADFDSAGELETAAGPTGEGAAADFIPVAGTGSSFSPASPIETEPGTFVTPPAGTTAANTVSEDDLAPPVPPPPIVGGPGADLLTGTSAADTIYGGAGDDTIAGGAGDDLIYGGAGEDLIIAGLGADRIFGGDDADSIVFAPGDGDDTVFDFGIGDTLLFAGALAGDVDIAVSGDGLDLIISVQDGGDEVNRVTVDAGASYTVTETQTPDGVVVAIDPNP